MGKMKDIKIAFEESEFYDSNMSEEEYEKAYNSFVDYWIDINR